MRGTTSEKKAYCFLKDFVFFIGERANMRLRYGIFTAPNQMRPVVLRAFPPL